MSEQRKFDPQLMNDREKRIADEAYKLGYQEGRKEALDALRKVAGENRK